MHRLTYPLLVGRALKIKMEACSVSSFVYVWVEYLFLNSTHDFNIELNGESYVQISIWDWWDKSVCKLLIMKAWGILVWFSEPRKTNNSTYNTHPLPSSLEKVDHVAHWPASICYLACCKPLRNVPKTKGNMHEEQQSSLSSGTHTYAYTDKNTYIYIG